MEWRIPYELVFLHCRCSTKKAGACRCRSVVTEWRRQIRACFVLHCLGSNKHCWGCLRQSISMEWPRQPDMPANTNLRQVLATALWSDVVNSQLICIACRNLLHVCARHSSWSCIGNVNTRCVCLCLGSQ